MNFKTTLILAGLVVAGGLIWFFWSGQATDVHTGPSARLLEKELWPEALARIEITSGSRKTVLERAGEDEWSLPGKWPVRTNEAKELERTLTQLRSRFTPIPLSGDGKAQLREYGLDNPAVVVKLTLQNKKEHTLAFGEKPTETN